MTFFNFFAIFSGIFLPGLGRIEIVDNFFFLFLGLSQPGLYRNNARMKIFHLLIFFAIFLEFSSPGRVRTEINTNIFLSLSLPISTRFG